MSNHYYTEVYDDKSQRLKTRLKTWGSFCKECRKHGGHEIDCPEITTEDLALLLHDAQKKEEWAREKAARYHDQLQRLTGKLAMLRHENNKLRKANERLREGSE